MQKLKKKRNLKTIYYTSPANDFLLHTVEAIEKCKKKVTFERKKMFKFS